MDYQHLNVTPASTAIGAFVNGLDLKDELSREVLTELRQAHAEHGVLFFRDQQLTPEEHVAFAERVGTININRFFTAVDGYPNIAEVRKEPDQSTNIGGGWH
ncbi:MAG: TauD/TfdA dioxygenase family protein, partial [Lysobacterales bacterium]